MSEIVKKENVYGGKGTAVLEVLLNSEQLNDKCNLFAKVTLEIGCSVGHHQHIGDSEAYYILSGEGIYDDNGVMVKAVAGDLFFCNDKGWHGIENVADKPLTFMALVIKE